MSSGGFNPEAARDLLSEAIVHAIRSWPEDPRRIFMLVHYAGRSIEEVADSTGMKPVEVRRILEAYERRLRSSLRSFRHHPRLVVEGKESEDFYLVAV